MGSKGQNFWNGKPKTGRRRLYEDDQAELLEAHCFEYFAFTVDRTDWDRKIYVGKDATERDVEQPNPFTLGGLCVFLGMSMETWTQYRKKEAFSDVCTRIELIIRTQKFEGATTGHFNHAIIARDLGMMDPDKNQENGNTIKIEFAPGLDPNNLLKE